VYEKQVVGTGMTEGDQIQVAGEATGREGTNDLGESPLLSLQYRHPTNSWQNWNGYLDSVMDSPFVIKGITSDPNNNLFVYGNNKSPVPADAPCP